MKADRSFLRSPELVNGIQVDVLYAGFAAACDLLNLLLFAQHRRFKSRRWKLDEYVPAVTMLLCMPLYS